MTCRRRSGGERYQVVVHVEAERLRDRAAGCQLEDGPALAAETVRRIACDASLVTIERDGEPLNVGRKRRSVPAAFTARSARDAAAASPAASTAASRRPPPPPLGHGGKTKLENLVLLCRPTTASSTRGLAGRPATALLLPVGESHSRRRHACRAGTPTS